jgi:hypothetical protein
VLLDFAGRERWRGEGFSSWWGFFPFELSRQIDCGGKRREPGKGSLSWREAKIVTPPFFWSYNLNDENLGLELC